MKMCSSNNRNGGAQLTFFVCHKNAAAAIQRTARINCIISSRKQRLSKHVLAWIVRLIVHGSAASLILFQMKTNDAAKVEIVVAGALLMGSLTSYRMAMAWLARKRNTFTKGGSKNRSNGWGDKNTERWRWQCYKIIIKTYGYECYGNDDRRKRRVVVKKEE